MLPDGGRRAARWFKGAQRFRERDHSHNAKYEQRPEEQRAHRKTQIAKPAIDLQHLPLFASPVGLVNVRFPPNADILKK